MNDMSPMADQTLDDVRARLAPLVAANAAFDGWSAKAVTAAAAQAGVDADIAGLAFDGGALAMIEAWFTHVDGAMRDALPLEALAPMRFREKIVALVEARLDILAPDREALRRAQAILALPNNLSHAARLGWRAADSMWRAAGDVSTDYNHYTKRTTLGAVYGATLLILVNDESEGHADTRAFLGRRIDDIMRFERAKAKLAGSGVSGFDPARFLGRLRYRN